MQVYVCICVCACCQQLAGPTVLTVPTPAGPKTFEFGVIDTCSYPLEDGSGALSVSTTRLETMVGDVAVAVHPEDERYKHLIGECGGRGG